MLDMDTYLEELVFMDYTPMTHSHVTYSNTVEVTFRINRKCYK